MSTINYVHHNPVKHGLVERWRDWTWSSADKYLQSMGRDRACEIWTKYAAKNAQFEWDDF